MPVCIIVKTITPGCFGQPDAPIAPGIRPHVFVHHENMLFTLNNYLREAVLLSKPNRYPKRKHT